MIADSLIQSPLVFAMRFAVLVVAAALVPIGCGDETADRGSAERSREGQASETHRFGARYVRQAAWDTVFQLDASPGDTLLLPRRLAARDGRVYVIDYGDHALKAFSFSGTLLWRFGRRGEGPGEFAFPVDMEVDEEGKIWILDRGRGVNRIAIISPAGEWIGTRPLNELARDVLPLEKGEYILVTHDPGDNMFVVFDRDDDVVERGVVPDPRIARAFYTARQTMSSLSAVDHRSWVAPFVLGDLFLVYDRTSVRCQGQFVEGGALPQEAYQEPPPVWVVAAAMDEKRVYMLAKGETGLALKLLDIYDARDCRYIESIELPGEFRTMALAGDVFVFESEDPYPTVLGLRLDDR